MDLSACNSECYLAVESATMTDMASKWCSLTLVWFFFWIMMMIRPHGCVASKVKVPMQPQFKNSYRFDYGVCCETFHHFSICVCTCCLDTFSCSKLTHNGFTCSDNSRSEAKHFKNEWRCIFDIWLFLMKLWSYHIVGSIIKSVFIQRPFSVSIWMRCVGSSNK